MKELTVYGQLTSGVQDCLSVLNKEIGMKTNCMPFALKLIEALKTLNIRTEQESTNAANTLLSGLQTLAQGGIKPEDYDKIDFVKRGGVIVPSARVEAFYRAAARKGYRITDTIVAVPYDDRDTTYFKENFYNGDIIYTLEDKRNNADRDINAQRLISKYFSKFICRLNINEVKTNKLIAMSVCEMSIDDMLAVSCTSEQGLYKSKWEKYKDNYGNEKRRKVITEELNTGTFWVLWTGEMVKKTIIRRALKRIKEVLPELTDTIYAFEQDEYMEEFEKKEEPVITIPVESENVALDKLTEEQIDDCREMYELFKVNPKLAVDKFNEIKEMINNGETAQEIINKEYASIFVLQRYYKNWGEIGGYFDAKGKS